MRVLLISLWKPRKGGIVTHVENIIKRSKHDFLILTYRDKAVKDSVHVTRVPYINIPVLRGISFAFFSFLKAIRAEFDIVHAHYAIPQGFSGALIKIVRKKPLLLTVHGSDLTILGGNPFVRPVLKWILRKTDLIIAVSEYMKDLLLDLGVEENKIHVIYNGVDLQKPAKGKEKRVVYIGALVNQKGVDVLIKGFKTIKSAHRDATLVIVGDGPQKEDLMALAQRLGIIDVEFMGYLEDIDHVFTENTVLVLPSRQEGFGISILEAMARNVPVAASKTGGIVEIIIDGRNGLLFTKDNQDSLADAVIKIFEKPDLRHKLIGEGRKTLENFTWNKTSARTEEIYEKLTGKGLRA